MITYNFCMEEPPNFSKDKAKQYYDTRNAITCYDPDFSSIDCYINYIDLLNLNRDRWTNCGYLDLGMMPLAMAPSFLQDSVSPVMIKFMNRLHCPVYSLPPVSLLCKKCNVSSNDIWVFKKDISKLTGMPEEKTNLCSFIRWCLNAAV